jgi:hypothetical protein
VLVLGLAIATTTAFLEFLWVARTIFTAQNVSKNIFLIEKHLL